MSTALGSPSVASDVSPEEIAAVEVALRHFDLQRTKQNTLALVSQWFLLLGMFREMEVAFSKGKNRQRHQQKHRAVVASLMGFGELLVAESEGLGEKDFERCGFSRTTLVANVKYLRDKYEQWYVEVSSAELHAVTQLLLDEREVHIDCDLPPKVEA